jgi:hypothetical protein
MTLLRSLRLIFTTETYVVALLAGIATYVCYLLELYADFTLTLIGIAVVFPIVFSINGAYKRREIALDHYANIKSHGRALYFATRDWTPKTDVRLQNRIKRILYDLLFECRIMFNSDHSDDDIREAAIYEQFSKLSLFVEELRKRGITSGEVSRCNQFVSKMLISYENMKHIYQYRTPITLRAYSKVFIFVLPVIYGPYFANLARGFPYYFMFFMPILFSLILVSLDNIQDQLENPFDLIGEDDININVEKFIKGLGPD